VRLSGDGQVMVFHDETLGRLTGAAGRVDATPASVLAGLKVLCTAETIPTLGDLLATVGGRVPLVVELKSDYSGDPGLARRVAEMVAGYD
ncbi:glycerophosphodiester phosphodiesterase family protein, partial [Escherichia coli]|uniref:glycerophosphodiester phosphodiesterase family protein n=1 Tax=Escherichia coli TaxID=562 RepID=UPI001952D1E1